MQLTPAKLEGATYDSWNHMFNGAGKLTPLDGVPVEDRDYALWSSKAPEAVDIHRRTVAAILEADFNLDIALRKLTNGKQGVADLNDRSRTFRLTLIEFLKNWAKTNMA
jgi:hypothetical protein